MFSAAAIFVVFRHQRAAAFYRNHIGHIRSAHTCPYLPTKHTGYIGPAHHHMYLPLHSHRFPQTSTSMHLLRVSCRRSTVENHLSAHTYIYLCINSPIYPSIHPSIEGRQLLLINERNEPTRSAMSNREKCRGVCDKDNSVGAPVNAPTHNKPTRTRPGPYPL